jgi:hypothetical protein
MLSMVAQCYELSLSHLGASKCLNRDNGIANFRIAMAALVATKCSLQTDGCMTLVTALLKVEPSQVASDSCLQANSRHHLMLSFNHPGSLSTCQVATAPSLEKDGRCTLLNERLALLVATHGSLHNNSRCTFYSSNTSSASGLGLLVHHVRKPCLLNSNGCALPMPMLLSSTKSSRTLTSQLTSKGCLQGYSSSVTVGYASHHTAVSVLAVGTLENNRSVVARSEKAHRGSCMHATHSCLQAKSSSGFPTTLS